MMYLNFSNIEELIFHDQNAQKLLPVVLFSQFEQWRLSKRFPMLKSLGKQALLDVLNQLTDTDIEALEIHFGQRIMLERLDYSVTKNIKLRLSERESCEALCEIEGFGYFSTWRDDEYIYISLWR